MQRVQGLRALLHSEGCRVPASLFSSPPAGSFWETSCSRSKRCRPCQGVPRTPSGPARAASLSSSLLMHSHPFPWDRLTPSGPTRHSRRLLAGVWSSSRKSEQVAPAPRAHARRLLAPPRAPRRARAAGAHFRDAERGPVEALGAVICAGVGRALQLGVSGRPQGR